MSTTLKYRPDLDGIRALAVLAVIIFHIDAAWLPGGFLGVDMFFVLSGYLITTIISREMQNGSFSFLEFYKRRAKRILPVFSCVLLCTSLAAAIFFLSFDLRQYVKSAVFALLFSANLFFARRGGYFDADAAEKPLQHIWSLSLEEQFYFVFPVLLTAFFRFSKGRNIRQFILLLIILSLLSVFLPTFGMDPYFLPYVRAYELLIGALFAFIPPSQTNDRFSTPLVGWAMMAVIAAMLLLPYGVLPGEGNIERLLCCTAVGGLIYSGKTLQTQSGFNTAKLLSLKPVVFIGLVIAAYFALLIPAAGYLLTAKPAAYEANLYTVDESKICADTLTKTDCAVGAENQSSKVLLMGDSHAAHLTPFIDIVGKQEGFAADVISSNSCGVAFGFMLPQSDRRANRCNPYNRFIAQKVENYPVVFISQRWFLHADIFRHQPPQHPRCDKTGGKIYTGQTNTPKITPQFQSGTFAAILNANAAQSAANSMPQRFQAV